MPLTISIYKPLTSALNAGVICAIRKAMRPLSPHLQIYRPTMTMLMSIAHRLSGLALYGLALGFILWLNLLAFAPSYFDLAQTYLSSTEGQVALFISLWIFCHHLCGGLRHFIWDLGLGLGHYGREIFAFGTFIFGLLLAVGIFLAPNYEIILQELNR